MFVNRFARAFSLHDVLGDIEGSAVSSTVANGLSQSVFHEVSACLATATLLASFTYRNALAWQHSKTGRM